jgi:predicted aspartyl protease
MGKVVVAAKIENIDDLYRAEHGDIPRDQVRAVEVSDALVDTGASTLLLPKKVIQRLGLKPFKTRPARGLGGAVQMPIYSVVRLTIQGRECHLDVGEVPDDFPVIVGQIPLEMLDWVLDAVGQRLIGNPEHGGEHVIDVF